MKTNVSRRVFLGMTGALAGACTSGSIPGIESSSLQDSSPNRPIRLVVPAPAGSRADLAGRSIASILERHLGEPVGVVNPEGSPASIHAAIAATPADGRTLGLLTVDIAAMHWRGLTRVNYRDYTPLAMLSDDPAGIHVRAEGPFDHARQLMEHIRARPGTVKVGSAVGGIWHLSAVGWMAAAGLDAGAMQLVPSSGLPASLQDLAAGGADVVVCSIPEVRARAEVRSLRTVAVLCQRRNPRFPEVATLQELIGVRYSVGAWRGVAGPKGLPSATATRLSAALRKGWDSAEFQDSMRRKGFRPIWRGAQEFAAFMEAEDKRLGAFVQAAGIARA